MILGPVSYIDCVVFCIFLAPQLVWHLGLFPTILTVLRALPFLLIKLPLSFLHDHALADKETQSPFVQQATLFEDFVIRCVRYAFANIEPSVGRIFFSYPVAWPFFRWRMIRHGYLWSYPCHIKAVDDGGLKGVWLTKDPTKKNDFVLYYAHGGGFAMGSPYFYLEFLSSWLSLLCTEGGYSNPAIFALQYSLVPDAAFPTQIKEVINGYRHADERAQQSSVRVCVGGDSAGATLILSLMIHLSTNRDRYPGLLEPGMTVLISPWVTLVSELHKNNASDYLNARSLEQYGRQYAGDGRTVRDPLVSPGSCRVSQTWRNASPPLGLFVTYGKEEVFAGDIEAWASSIKSDVDIYMHGEPNGIHAWPVVSLFLSSTETKRLKGLRRIVKFIRDAQYPNMSSSVKAQPPIKSILKNREKVSAKKV